MTNSSPSSLNRPPLRSCESINKPLLTPCYFVILVSSLMVPVGLLSTAFAADNKPIVKSELPKKWQPAVKTRDWKFLVLHHSATKAGSVKSIDAAHRQRKTPAGEPWRGIGYHFVIGNGNSMGDGKVEPTFRWTKQLSGAHAGSNKYNQAGIGICLIGNFENTKPTKLQLQAIKDLTQQLAKVYQISEKSIVGHREVRATKCPGKNFPLKEIRKHVTAINKVATKKKTK